MTSTHSSVAYHITQVRCVLPAQQYDAVGDVWLYQGQLLTQAQAQATASAVHTVEGKGLWLTPTFIDGCTRLREPGLQQHGTFATEGQAARIAGFYDVVMPPDTSPVLEKGALLAGLKERAWQLGGVHLHILGALTEGLQGKKPANLASLKSGGAIGYTNAQSGFENSETLVRIFEYAQIFELPIVVYPQDLALSAGGVAHEGVVAAQMGLPTIPRLAETIALSRILDVAYTLGVRVHISLLSCGESVQLIRQAKARGILVTADVALHQLLLTDEVLTGYNVMAHVIPPLREECDRQALLAGVLDGTIDAICSHHQPLSTSAKQVPFGETEAGISAYDTFIAGLVFLQDQGVPLATLIRCLTEGPMRAFGLDTCSRGFNLIDPSAAQVVTAQAMCSAGKNTPFLGSTLRGKLVQSFLI